MTETFFTERELDVMSILWKEGSATVTEVRERLADELAYTSVLSALQTLEEKGYVRHEQEGRAYRYFPLVAPEQASRWPLSAQQQAIIDKQGALWIVGDPQQVKTTIEAQAEAAGADEVMVTTTVWSHEHRLRSYRLLAKAFGL